jgi:hypothetical protein
VSEPEQKGQNGGAGTQRDEDGRPSIAEVAAGYITALVVLVYPIGLLTFAAQLWTTFGYAPNTSYFAASLAPTAVGAARVGHSFLWFLVAIVAVITILRNLEIPRNLRNARSLRGLLAALRGDPPNRPKLKQWWRTITIIVFTVLIVPLSSGTPIVISTTGPTDLFTQRGLILYGTFVILVGISGFGGVVWGEEITRKKRMVDALRCVCASLSRRHIRGYCPSRGTRFFIATCGAGKGAKQRGTPSLSLPGLLVRI